MIFFTSLMNGNIAKLQLKQTYLSLSMRKLLGIISKNKLFFSGVLSRYKLGPTHKSNTRKEALSSSHHQSASSRSDYHKKYNYTPRQKTDQWRTKERKKTGHWLGPLPGSACPTSVHGQDGRRFPLSHLQLGLVHLSVRAFPISTHARNKKMQDTQLERKFKYSSSMVSIGLRIHAI